LQPIFCAAQRVVIDISAIRSQAVGSVRQRTTVQVHATCVEIARLGVLLCGASGSGKSDLALRAIASGARLVADDRVDLWQVGRIQAGRIQDGTKRLRPIVWAQAPAALAGFLEVRGIGIVREPAVKRARVGLVIELVDKADIERLPLPRSRTLLGQTFPLLALDPFAASAVAKLFLAVKLVRRQALFAH
jgi:serine kinase of HPr protein (carbohydrate metabolism regulator)